MRSGLIFAVSEKFTNRYMLCRMVAASARKMHRDGVSTSQSINRSLQVLQGTPEITPHSAPPVIPEPAPEAVPASAEAALVP